MDLPVPPSVNELFPGKVRRFKSAKYKRWIAAAGWEINMQKVRPVSGPYRLSLEFAESLRGDVSNRVKAVEDLLVTHRLTADDRYGELGAVKRSPDVLKDRCRVRVEAR